jgi:hypothetical protein
MEWNGIHIVCQNYALDCLHVRHQVPFCSCTKQYHEHNEKLHFRTKRAQIGRLPRRVQVSWTRSPWSRSSVSTAGQPASRRVATSSWAAGRKAAAVQEQTRRRHLLLLLLLLGLGARGRGGGGQDGRMRVLRSLRTARRKIDGGFPVRRVLVTTRARCSGQIDGPATASWMQARSGERRRDCWGRRRRLSR